MRYFPLLINRANQYVMNYSLKNKRGFLIVESLIAAAMLAVIAVVMLSAFGNSNMVGNASTDYVVAKGLAQKQIEILKLKSGYSGFWLNTPNSYPTDFPNVIWSDENNVQAIVASGSVENRLFILLNDIEYTVDVFARVSPEATLPSGKIAECTVHVSWLQVSANGAHREMYTELCSNYYMYDPNNPNQ